MSQLNNIKIAPVEAVGSIDRSWHDDIIVGACSMTVGVTGLIGLSTVIADALAN